MTNYILRTCKPSGEKCVVVHVGDMISSVAFLVDHGCDGPIVGRTATAEDRGTATAGDGGTATAGDWGTATAGDGGTATAGDGGTIIISYYKDGGYRRKVGLIGEGGLKAGVAYRVDHDTSEFVEA